MSDMTHQGAGIDLHSVRDGYVDLLHISDRSTLSMAQPKQSSVSLVDRAVTQRVSPPASLTEFICFTVLRICEYWRPATTLYSLL